MPSQRYLPYFQHFCFPRRIAQLVVSTAKDHPLLRFDDFLARFVSMTDMFGKTYEEQHLWDSVCIHDLAIASFNKIADCFIRYKKFKTVLTTIKTPNGLKLPFS
jgi:hypothetical protein